MSYLQTNFSKIVHLHFLWGDLVFERHLEVGGDFLYPSDEDVSHEAGGENVAYLAVCYFDL